MPITVRTLCWAEDALHGDDVRAVEVDPGVDRGLEGQQALGDVVVGRRTDVTDRDHVQRTSGIALDHAQATAGQAGVNPEHAHDRPPETNTCSAR